MMTKTKANPIVSIIIPTKNREKLVEHAIFSALNQTIENIEVIVINDGSTDSTRTRLADINRSYSNLVIINSKTSQGACKARNLGISKAKGKFITNLDDDDIIDPDRIESFLQMFDEKWAFICTNYKFVGSGLTYRTVYPESDISFNDIKKRNFVGNSIFTLKSRLLDCGMYDESLTSWQDYDLWFRLIKHYGNARRINNHSYKVNIENNRSRITSSSSSRSGYQQFINKHKSDLSKTNLKEQEINDIINRSEFPSPAIIIRNFFRPTAIKRILMHILRLRLPTLYNYIIRLISK